MAGAMNNWKNILTMRVRKEHQYPSDYDSVRSLCVLEFRFPRRSSSTATASPVSCILGLARSVIWQRKGKHSPLDLDLTAVRCGARWGMDMVLSLPQLWPSVTGHPSICSSILHPLHGNLLCYLFGGLSLPNISPSSRLRHYHVTRMSSTSLS